MPLPFTILCLCPVSTVFSPQLLGVMANVAYRCLYPYPLLSLSLTLTPLTLTLPYIIHCPQDPLTAFYVHTTLSEGSSKNCSYTTLFRGSSHSIVDTQHTVRRILSKNVAISSTVQKILSKHCSHITHCPEGLLKALDVATQHTVWRILSKYVATSSTVRRILLKHVGTSSTVWRMHCSYITHCLKDPHCSYTTQSNIVQRILLQHCSYTTHCPVDPLTAL